MIHSSGLATEILYAFLASGIRAKLPVNHILYDLVILMVFDEGYKLWSSSLCIFLHSAVSSSLSGKNIIPSTLFSNTLNLCFSLQVIQIGELFQKGLFRNKSSCLCSRYFTAAVVLLTSHQLASVHRTVE